MADQSVLLSMAQTHLFPFNITKKNHSKLSQNQVATHFKKINAIIDAIDDHIAQQLDTHEVEMLAVVKNQIDQMKSETRTMVERLNHMIDAKNDGEELWHLNNELEYFKNQSHVLFKQNKQLRVQINRLGKSIVQMRMQLEEKDEVLHKLKKTCLREKLSKTKNERQESEATRRDQHGIEKHESMNHSLNLKTLTKTKRNFMTEPDEQKKQQPLKLIQSKINIRVSSHNKDLTPLTLLDDDAKINQKITVPSLMHQNGLHATSEIKMKWANSCFAESSAKVSCKKVDQAVQTELPEPARKRESSNKNAVLQIPPPNLSRYTTNLDFSKNGFVTSCKKKSHKIHSFNSQVAGYCQEDFRLRDRDIKLINNTINRNKMKASLHQMINKSSMQ